MSPKCVEGDPLRPAGHVMATAWVGVCIVGKEQLWRTDPGLSMTLAESQINRTEVHFALTMAVPYK